MAMYRDALTWVDTAAIGYPALHQKLVELTMPALVVKQLLPEISSSFSKVLLSSSHHLSDDCEFFLIRTEKVEIQDDFFLL
jgi:hypothetical protein